MKYGSLNRSRISFSKIIVWLLIVVIGFLALLIFLNREWVHDYLRGRAYEPSSEMERIRRDLALTERGEFLFNAAQPRLSERDEFNDHCRPGDNSEIAVLGCYVNDNIYVYNIKEAELDGIRELTAAHELLHMVFARMSETEKNELRGKLDQVYKDNVDILKEDLETYDSAEQFEELYVRAGTEVADLPASLEKHYGEFFKDQDRIVTFYNEYIAVFREIEAEEETLKQEMAEIGALIETNKKKYGEWLKDLNAKIEEFNGCANMEGCFESQAMFYVQRSNLIAEQKALEAFYNETNALIDQYNEKVVKYNENVLRGEELNRIVNSNEGSEKIE